MTKFPVKEPRRNLVFGFILSLSVLLTSTSISFAQGAYGGSEYMDGPPQPFRPPTSELTQVPPPEAPLHHQETGGRVVGTVQEMTDNHGDLHHGGITIS